MSNSRITRVTLHEARRPGALLLEARVDFLRGAYIPRLEQALPSLSIPPTVQHDLDGMEGDNTAEKLFSYVASFDPDPVKKNTQWLLNLVLIGARASNGDGMKLEDGYKATRYLQLFAKAKPHLPQAQRDLGRYRSLGSLYVTLKQFDRSDGDGEQVVDTDFMSNREQARIYDRKMHDEATIIYNGPDYKILIPRTKEASIYFGRNTEWCNAATTSRNYFHDYNDLGPIFMILHKPTNRRWQIHFEEAQFMDENDVPVNPASFIEEHPKVQAIFEQMEGTPIVDDIDLSGLGANRFKQGAIFAMPDRRGLILKAGRGLTAYSIMSIVSPNGNDEQVRITRKLTDSSLAIASKKLRDALTEALNDVGVTGLTGHTLSLMGIYGNNGRWGKIERVGQVIYHFSDGYRWRECVVLPHLRHLVLTDGATVLAHATISDGSFRMETDDVKNHAAIGDHVVDLLISHRDHITSWDVEHFARGYRASALSNDQVSRLFASRPELVDFATVYRAKGDTPETRDVLVQRLAEHENQHTTEWIGDRLVIERFDSIIDAVDAVITATTDRMTNFILDVVRDNDTISFDHDESDVEIFGSRILRALPTTDLVRLGSHLAHVHPDQVDEDFDPADPEAVWRLANDIKDDDVMFALSLAAATGREEGAADEANKLFKRAVERSGYFLMADEDRWTGHFHHDVPAVIALRMEQLAAHVDGSAVRWTAQDWITETAEPFVIAGARQGFSEFDVEAAAARFTDEMHGLLSDA